MLRARQTVAIIRRSFFLALSLLSGLLVSQVEAQPARKAAKPVETARPQVRDYTSRNFLVHTDLSAEEAKELLERLETMLVIISKYWSARSSRVIEMYVVEDLANWPPDAIDPAAMESIQNRAGITLSTTRFLRDGFGNEKITDARSVVYAIADRGVPQHEAVHAFCHQAFGRVGPTWYAEGMAELGQYWRDKQSSVQIHEEVLNYLQESAPKPLSEIVDLTHETGDSWQNYAWRWALCHLLNYNKNYHQRFRPLGLAILNGQNGSFEQTYGSMSREIEFEYRFFLEHIEQGFRCDLCSWDWKVKPVGLRSNGSTTAKIDAKLGWQPSRLLAKAGTTYTISTTGTWKTAADAEELSADGDANGKGKLWGVIFDDYTLSEPFELSAEGNWTAPQDGHLFLRCHDSWGELEDNSGMITVKCRVTP